MSPKYPSKFVLYIDPYRISFERKKETSDTESWFYYIEALGVEEEYLIAEGGPFVTPQRCINDALNAARKTGFYDAHV